MVYSNEVYFYKDYYIGGHPRGGSTVNNPNLIEEIAADDRITGVFFPYAQPYVGTKSNPAFKIIFIGEVVDIDKVKDFFIKGTPYKKAAVTFTDERKVEVKDVLHVLDCGMYVPVSDRDELLKAVKNELGLHLGKKI